jgi:nucleoid-associated protein YgaU
LGSLTAHLLETGDHSRLGFHPRCPVCRRQRLFGSLCSEPVIPRRLQAVLASGVLAFSAAAPGAAAAVPPDRQQEGVAAPERPGGGSSNQPTGDGIDAPDFDPGGGTALPFEVAPSPNAPLVGGGSEDTGEGAPVDSEPVDDPDARLLGLTEPEQATPPEADAPVPPAEVAPVQPAPSASDPTLTEAPPADPKAPTDPSAPDAPPRPERNAKESESNRARERDRTPEARGTTPAPPETTIPTPEPQPPIATPPQGPAPSSPTLSVASAEPVSVAQASTPTRAAQPPIPTSARSHVVEAGESLWSIARRLLGPDASPAQVAREVDRLWELNKERIGTGDPDLLMVGVTLRLR